MIKKLKNQLKLNKIFKGDDSRFILATGIKISGVYLICAMLVIYLMWLILSINNIFFDANGFLDYSELNDVFFDSIMTRMLQNTYYIMGFFILIFFAGCYLATLLLRPFKIIGEYCDLAVENKEAIYNPDIFSDFKLLTRFSDFFYRYIYEARCKKKFEVNTIPSGFLKIHGPVFDKVFFFHFMLFISIIAIVTSMVLVVTTIDTYDSLIELAIKTLPNNKNEITSFLKNQKYLFDSIIWFSIIVLLITYTFLSFHLYSKVTGAVFGFFSTMRSFIKGNTKARVHLVGYPHIRPFSRSFNKYLDAVCREIENETKS